MKYVFDLLRYRRYNYDRVWFEDILLFVFIGKHFVIVIWKPDILCGEGNKMNDRIDAVLVDTSVYHKKQCDFEGITNSIIPMLLQLLRAMEEVMRLE